MNYKITEIFYFIGEFCKKFDNVKQGYALMEETAKKGETAPLAGFWALNCTGL